MYTEQNNSAKEEIASIIQKLEDVVKKMADSREEISDDNISKAYTTLNDIEIELQRIAGKVAGLKFKIEE
tara:strand:+ start:747 stop:956 length:210 start_codon:yes stop_codon:yes gene_type:complete